MRFSIPDQMKRVAVLIRTQLTPDELSYTTTVMNRAPWNRWSGQNRMHGLGIRMNLGVVLWDAAMVKEAFNGIWTFLRLETGGESDTACGALSGGRSRRGQLVTLVDAAGPTGTGNGIQVDGCFYQHGPMQQTASYGEVFMYDVMKFVGASLNTSFEMTQQAEVALSTLLLNGQQVGGRS